MTDEEYLKQVEAAKFYPDTRFCTFMKRTAGYKFFSDSPVCIPKYILFERYKYYPHQLELIEQGIHPDFRRVIKDGFDKVQEELWNLNIDENEEV